MSDVHFRFSPNILVRLGEELNQGTDQSILELIKNSYDADARTCKVELRNTSSAGGSITITDDGDGMSALSIKDSWLVLGKSSKSHNQTTALGRTPSGSKGLGRLAALRMGRAVRLESKMKSSLKSSVLNVEWDKFDNANTVEDVQLVIEEAVTSKIKGTVTELSNLRLPIRSDELKKLARAVLLLTDPFENKESGFKVELNAPEFKEVERLLKLKYFNSSEYHLVARLSDDGMASAEILDWDGKVLHVGTHLDIRNKSKEKTAKKNKSKRNPHREDENEDEVEEKLETGRYFAPGCKFDFWAFLLKKESFSAGDGVNIGDVREWLKHFGGVHVYQDDVRVSPYGSPGDDWLGINLIRTRSPEERPSTNNSIGRVSLSNKGAFTLTQKTDRSGYIEDDTYLELKKFIIDSLDWMARWRLIQAEKRRGAERALAPDVSIREKEKFQVVLNEAPAQVRAKLSAAFDQYAKSRDKETDILRKEIQLYRTLSTAGITAATFAHESHGNPIKVIELAVNVIDSKIQGAAPPRVADSIQRILIKIRGALDALSILGLATLSLVRANKRRVGRVEINEAISHIDELMRPFWSARDTVLNLKLSKGKPYLKCTQAALESIITNLINNSLNAFRRDKSSERIIEISTEVEGDYCLIIVMDSGPGIRQQNIEEIWLPGVTSDPDGTGLGLTIVRDTVKDLGGHVEAIAVGDLGGAEFRIRLPILGC